MISPTPLSVALGALLALGLLLCASPWLWPLGSGTRRAPRTTSWLNDQLAHAGLARLTMASFSWLVLLCALLGGALALAFSGIGAVGLLGALAGGALPVTAVTRRAQHHRQTVAGLWPDVLDHLLGATRAGLGLPDALSALAIHGPAELRPVFQEFALDYRQSASWTLSLDALKARCADPTADRLCEILRVAREVGGTDLVPVLRAFGGYLREDAAARAELLARQSWVTNAARLAVAAPWLVLFVLSMRPEARAAYNSPAGVALILFGFGVSVLAYQIMRAIGRLRSERRWAPS